MRQFSLDYDADYGVDHRTGWSVVIDGIVWSSFQAGPIRALWLAVWRRLTSSPRR